MRQKTASPRGRGNPAGTAQWEEVEVGRRALYRILMTLLTDYEYLLVNPVSSVLQILFE